MAKGEFKLTVSNSKTYVPYSFKTNYLAKICSCKYALYFYFLQTCPRELLISCVPFSTRKFSFVTEPLHVSVFLSVKLKSCVFFLPLGKKNMKTGDLELRQFKNQSYHLSSVSVLVIIPFLLVKEFLLMIK